MERSNRIIGTLKTHNASRFREAFLLSKKFNTKQNRLRVLPFEYFVPVVFRTENLCKNKHL